jgi:hypothetical protein
MLGRLNRPFIDFEPPFGLNIKAALKEADMYWLSAGPSSAVLSATSHYVTLPDDETFVCSQ